MVAACLKPCERTGLIDGMGEEYSLDIGVRKKNSLCTFSSCLWFSVAVAAIVFIVAVFTTDSIDNMSAQKQIDLLNADTVAGEVSSGCQSTLIIMRHCEFTTDDELGVEDEEGNQHCSAVGLERAEYIPTLFGDGAKWPLPTTIYAMKRDRDGVREGDDQVNLREIETLTPLSDKAGVDITVLHSDGGERRLAMEHFHHLGSGELCDKSTVISWQDKRIATLAQSLGCGENQGCPFKYKKRDFDKVRYSMIYWLTIREQIYDIVIDTFLTYTSLLCLSSTFAFNNIQVWVLTYTYWEIEDDEEEEDGGNDESGRRELKKKKKKKKKTITFQDGWNVHGRVVKMHFQPLAH